MRDEVGWLALGLALGNRQLLARLLADVPAAAFPIGRERQLFAALERGRGAVVAILGQLGVVVGDSQFAADAILAAATEHGERMAQQALARQVETAARMMTAEQFREWLAQAAQKHIGPQLANPEAAPAAEANGRQADTGRGEAPTVSAEALPLRAS